LAYSGHSYREPGANHLLEHSPILMHHPVDEKRLAESRDECAELFADAEGVLKLARQLESPLAQRPRVRPPLGTRCRATAFEDGSEHSLELRAPG